MPDLPDGNVDLDEEWMEDIPRVAGGLIGETRADLQMHAKARAALLNLLLLDPTVTAVFDRWTDATSIGRLARRLEEHLKRIASTAGFANGQELMRAVKAAGGDTFTVRFTVADQAEADRVSRPLSDLVREADELLDALLAALPGFDAAPLFEEAVALVRDGWRVPWPWLAWELVRCWTLWLSSAPFGRTSVVNFWAEPNDLGQPAPTITFATKTGESLGDAMRRALDEVFAPLEAAAQAAQLPTGRRTNPEIVQRYTEWWYRHRIRGESVRSIAGKDEGKRKLVRHGIAQAERWLGIVNSTWKDAAA
ncbi:MAG: hypothetical protein M3Q03_09935 [Chloroflexota bacterium]|nr:hypothetical protein [Chloroflexota bacterium]